MHFRIVSNPHAYRSYNCTYPKSTWVCQYSSRVFPFQRVSSYSNMFGLKHHYIQYQTEVDEHPNNLQVQGPR